MKNLITKTRKCPRCNEIKTLNDDNFYKNKANKCGYCYYCKECKKAYARYYVKTENGKYINKKSMQKYLKTEKGKSANNKGNKKYRIIHKDRCDAYRCKWEKTNKEKKRALGMLSYRIRKGTILPANNFMCVKCSKPAEDYHHHNGYINGHELDVIAVCRVCHQMLHNNVV